MDRLAISELTTFRWSFEEDVARYRAAGISSIGIWRQKLADIGEQRGAALVREAALTAMRESMEIAEVTGAHLRTARTKVRPSLDAAQVANLASYAERREAR
jgi:SpoVK/Ycf46/Vps4 family AAA+-type ATPase